MPIRTSVAQRLLHCSTTLAVVAAALILPWSLRAQNPCSQSWIVRVKSGTSEKLLSNELPERLRHAGIDVSAQLKPVIASSDTRRELHAAHRIDRYYTVELKSCDSTLVQRSLADVEWVEQAISNHTYALEEAATDDSLSEEQWAVDRIGLPAAWDRTTGASTVRIGIIDTGIEWNHEDLESSIWINPAEDINGNGVFDAWSSGEIRSGTTGDLDGIDQDRNGYTDDVVGFDFVDQNIPNLGDWGGRDGIPFDDNGHGTNVSGVIGATRNNGHGIAGVAPGARIVAIRAFDATGDGQDDDIAAAIVYAADIGVDVLNMSFGDYYRSPLLEDALEYARARGVLCVASSGNNGVPDPHFPSGFDNVMSVGALTESDLRSPFSGFGSQLSLTAPGQRIPTTDIDNGYRTVDGTSFSAPYVAGVAALLKSVNPSWSAAELRSTIEVTAEDLGQTGWDTDFGAGIVRADRALDRSRPTHVELISPKSNGGSSENKTVSVVGTLLDPFLTDWSVSIGLGDLPTEWASIASGDRGFAEDSIGAFNIQGFPDTTLQIRLAFKREFGGTFEYRIRYVLDRGDPVLLDVSLDTIWFDNRSGLTLRAQTEKDATFRLFLRDSGSADQFRSFEGEGERNGFRRSHYLFLSPDEVTPGQPYELYMEFESESGATVRFPEPAALARVQLPAMSIPVSGFSRRQFKLPYGYLLDSLFRNGESVGIVSNRFQGLAFDELHLDLFDSDSFTALDSAGQYIPRGLGDVNGDGLLDIALQSTGRGLILSQSTPESSPFEQIIFADTTTQSIFLGGLYDLDGNGTEEIVGYRREPSGSERMIVAELSGSKLRELASIDNPTAPAPGIDRNSFGASDVVMSDLDGDGMKELVFADSDSDFLVYERQSDGAFVEFWRSEQNGSDGDKMIAIGDVTGNGRDDLAIAWRNRSGRTAENDYDPPVWEFRLYSFSTSGDPTLVDRQLFAWTRSSSTFRTGISIGDLDGQPGGEVALALFPGFYVFRYDSARRSLEPTWWRGDAMINHPLIADIDSDGFSEVAVGDGIDIEFYSMDRDATALRPPSGLDGWSIDTASILLRWDSVEGADLYRVYRGAYSGLKPPQELDLLLETPAATTVDSGVSAPGPLELQRRYAYVVTAVDNDSGGEESPASELIAVLHHRPASIDTVRVQSRQQLLLHITHPVGDRLHPPGAVELSDISGSSILLSTVQYSGDSTLLVSTAAPLAEQTLEIRLTELFRDRHGAPPDTSRIYAFSVAFPPVVDRFVAVDAEPLTNQRIRVAFNKDVRVNDAEDPAKYSVDPPGDVVDVELESGGRSVILSMPDSYPLGPFGFKYTVTVSDIEATDGTPIDTGAGGQVGFVIASENLDRVSVFPHPFSPEEDIHCTFSGLPRGAVVRIYSQSGQPVAELGPSEGLGGIKWDGLANDNRRVRPGVYLYTVEIPGDTSERVVRKIGVTE